MGFNYNKKYFKKLYKSSFYLNFVYLRDKAIHKEILKYVTSGSCLEIGFGNGSLIRVLKENFDVYGADISEFAVQKLSQEYDSSHFKVCDIADKEIPFKQKFDVIVAINIVEHLKDPKFALQNIFNALKKKGIFVLYLPTRSNILSKFQYKFLYDVKEHIFRPSVKSLRRIMRKLGFSRNKEFLGTLFPFNIKIGNNPFLNTFNLYFGIWEKA